MPAALFAMFTSVAPLATTLSSPLMRICMARAALATSAAAFSAAFSRCSNPVSGLPAGSPCAPGEAVRTSCAACASRSICLLNCRPT